MFSLTAEYALRASVQLAVAGGRGCSTKELAEKTQVPRAYLSKVLQSLRSAGLVESKRGVGGGVRLVARPESITVLAIINAVEPIRRIESCPLGLPSHGNRLCSLHAKMDSILGLLEESFRQTTLAEVIAGNSDAVSPSGHQRGPLCQQMPSNGR
jgi:Rrf2 family transcriptional regulator, nitric oxide-sensitive transcriptional repressor